MPAPVVVIGAGIAGVACARALQDAGVPVVVRDRGRQVGGRVGLRVRDGRAVDIGASYLTVRTEDFAEVVEDWAARGLARPWTDTFSVVGPDGIEGTTTGPVRWAAPAGLRSLIEDLAAGLVVEPASEVEDVGPGPTVDGAAVTAVVLAMPDPQALDVLADDLVDVRRSLDRPWDPALALYAAWDARDWPDLDGAFVTGSDVLTWLADDGRRRGDGAPVLVAHSTPQLAARYLDHPADACPELLEALQRLLGISTAPRWAAVKRWSLATPTQPRAEPYLLGTDLVGVCGDGWSPRSRIEGAYGSGRALGRELARRLR